MSTNAWIVVAVAAVVLAVAVGLVRRNRSPQSSVDSFRRQIDALGPAARRTVVDQVQQTASTRDPDDVTDGDEPGPDPAGEDGARGT